MKTSYIFLLLLSFYAGKIQAQIITTFTGGDTSFLGNGGPAINAQVAAGGLIRTDGVGNTYILDGNTIRKVNAAGIITPFAGGGLLQPENGNNAFDVSLSVASMAADSIGNLYVSDGRLRKIFKINPQGIISTVAGNGAEFFSGDGSLATNAGIGYINSMTVDRAGNIYIGGNSRIRKVNRLSGIITTIAGNGTSGYTGDGGLATAARLDVDKVFTDAFGNLFFSQYWYTGNSGNKMIRKINTSGIITTILIQIIGGEYYEDFGTDHVGNIFIATSYNRIYLLGPQNNFIPFAGTGAQASWGDGGPAISASFNQIRSIAVDYASNIFITDRFTHRIRKIDGSGIINSVAGTGVYSFTGEGTNSTKTAFGSLENLAADKFGNLYIADRLNHVVRKMTADGFITTIAGNKTIGFSGDGGPAINAQLHSPANVAVDTFGNIYIADVGNQRIRKINPAGIITTVAGNGFGNATIEGAATATSIYPQHVAVTRGGTIYFVQEVMIYKVTPPGSLLPGTLLRVAGRRGSGTQGFFGDGGPAINATLRWSATVFTDNNDNIYINDVGNGRIRKIAKNDTINTFAGNGNIGGNWGDGGPATSANIGLGIFSSIAGDGAGNIYISDPGNSTIRKVNKDGIISTIAGSGISGYTGDGGSASAARIMNPAALAMAPGGKLYVTQQAPLLNAVIRTIDFGSVLPLTLVSFNGQLNNRTVLLKWQAVNEANTKNYTIQRSSNGSTFIDVGTVRSASVPGTNNYTFTDLNPLEPLNLYRLKIEDNNGRFTYSNLLPIKLSGASKPVVFYPNPVKDIASILFRSNAADKYSITVTDNAGRLMKRVEATSAMGTNSIRFDVSNFPSGNYFIHIKSKSVKETIAFNKQ